MVVNDNAWLLAKRGAIESIVGSPPGASSLLHWAFLLGSAQHQVTGRRLLASLGSTL